VLAGVAERLLTSTIVLLPTKLDGHVAAQRPNDTQGETEHQRHPTGQIPKMTSRDYERGATAVQQLMDGLFCSLSFFIFLTLRLVKRFVQRKLCEETAGCSQFFEWSCE
jgi:hypothetical protein